MQHPPKETASLAQLGKAETARVAASVAKAATADRAADSARWEALQLQMHQDRRTDAAILDQRLAVNASSSAEQHTTAMAAVRQVEQQTTTSAGTQSSEQPLTADSATTTATLDPIALLQHRFDVNDQRTTSTMASLNDSLRLLKSRTQAAAVHQPQPFTRLQLLLLDRSGSNLISGINLPHLQQILKPVAPWQISVTMHPNRWIGTMSNSPGSRAILGRYRDSEKRDIWNFLLTQFVELWWAPTTTKSHLLWVLKGGLERTGLDNRLVTLSYAHPPRPATEHDGVRLRTNANDSTDTHANWTRQLSRLRLITRPRHAVATLARVYQSCRVEATVSLRLGLARWRRQPHLSAGDAHSFMGTPLRPLPFLWARTSALAMPVLSSMVEDPRNLFWASHGRTPLL